MKVMLLNSFDVSTIVLKCMHLYENSNGMQSDFANGVLTHENHGDGDGGVEEGQEPPQAPSTKKISAMACYELKQLKWWGKAQACNHTSMP